MSCMERDIIINSDDDLPDPPSDPARDNPAVSEHPRNFLVIDDRNAIDGAHINDEGEEDEDERSVSGIQRMLYICVNNRPRRLL